MVITKTKKQVKEFSERTAARIMRGLPTIFIHRDVRVREGENWWNKRILCAQNADGKWIEIDKCAFLAAIGIRDDPSVSHVDSICEKDGRLDVFHDGGAFMILLKKDSR